ncbi:hypothetical protein HNQ80_004355 [Anaerosolibacter carboniphilus]|uniref:Uncharacterized protein n=1 Tax=Anaerosolibacter carboniphilus TaxID=1417629 RepID=A0A841L7G8_9FIRM|nr:hypothetical protein [Anaerosolibacter carboniphilus]MBB6218215.1 hypothetical protein [Anaerosolibacter carboniphilus]
MSRRNENRLFVLNEPNAPRLNPALATEIGLNESLTLLQIEFWISISNNFIDGKRWTYQSIRDIQEKAFPFWSISTINRAIKALLDEGYIIEGNHNDAKYDKTRWFTLNFERLAELDSIQIYGVETRSSQNETGSNQNDTRSSQDETRSTQKETTIPETTTEITTENSTEENIPSQPPEEPDVEASKSYSLMAAALTDLLITKIKSNNKRARVPERNSALYEKWVDEIDKLNRIGPVGGEAGQGYSFDEIKRIILWCQSDGFWKNNILSTSKLREKVIQLENQMRGYKPKGGGSDGSDSKRVGRTGPSEESIRLERIAKEKGLIGEDGRVNEPECDF